MRKTIFYDAKVLLSKEGKEQNPRQRAQHYKSAKFKELEQDDASGAQRTQEAWKRWPHHRAWEVLGFLQGPQDLTELQRCSESL